MKNNNKKIINTSNSNNEIILTEPSSEHSQTIRNLPPIKEKKNIKK